MQTIPEEAMPVADIIRIDVEKPDDLPLPINQEPLNCYLRWGKYCPMGLHPKATSPTPTGTYTFPLDVTSESVSAFADWWDNIDSKDAQEAVDLLWQK